MPIYRLVLAASLVLLLAACGAAVSQLPENAVAIGSLRISDSWMRTPNSATNTDAVYMVIRNQGASADRLVRASSDAAAAIELHQSVLNNGVASMQPVDAIEIPAGGAVAIESGVYHLMLIDRTRLPQAGETITLELTFANAGTVSLPVEVRDNAPANTGSSTGDGAHQH